MQPAGEPHGRPEKGSADDAGQHRTDGPRIGDGVMDGHAQIGAQDRQRRKNQIEVDPIARTDRIRGEGPEQRRLAVDIGDNHKNGHRLGHAKENFHRVWAVHAAGLRVASRLMHRC